MSYLSARLFSRSLELQQNLGTRCAAGFLRNRGVPFSEALFMLTGRVL